jgi:DNA-binding Lrp family transcriptional regulator
MVNNSIKLTSLSVGDARLLDTLRKNARASVSDLARALGLSRSTVQMRLQRLESTGVIAGYTLRLGPAWVGEQLGAQSLMRVNPRLSAQVLAAAQRVAGVQALHSVAGEFDLLAQLSCPSAQALDQALDTLAAIDGVERTQSCVLLSAKFVR